jgi:hypothetical protein
MTEERSFQLYFEVLQHYYTPEEVRAICKRAGTLESLDVRWKRLDELIEESERRATVWRFIKTVGAAFGAGLAFLAVVKGLLPSGWLW